MTGLSAAQLRGLNKLGDVVIPGDDELPSFSASGAAEGVDRMLPYMYDSDRSGLLALLDVCARLPKPGVRAVVALAAGFAHAPEAMQGPLRMANIGVKGVIHSLYWSDLGYAGPSVHKIIGYDATLNESAYERHLAEGNHQ